MVFVGNWYLGEYLVTRYAATCAMLQLYLVTRYAATCAMLQLVRIVRNKTCSHGVE